MKLCAFLALITTFTLTTVLPVEAKGDSSGITPATKKKARTKTTTKKKKNGKIRKTKQLTETEGRELLEKLNIAPEKYQETLLQVAGEPDKVQVLAALLAVGADTTKANQKGETPLSIALDVGNAPAIRLFIQSKVAKVDEWNPLERAAVTGNTKKVLNLVKQGADIFEIGKSGFSAVHLAAAAWHLKCVEAMLRAPGIKEKAEALLKAPETNKTSRTHRLALRAATGENFQEEEGMYGTTQIGRSALQGSITEFNLTLAAPGLNLDGFFVGPEVGDSLVNVRVNIVRDLVGHHWLTNSPYRNSIIHCLLKYSPGPLPPLHKAVISGNAKEVRMLLKKGADINARPQACSPESATNTKSSTSNVLQFETVLQYAIWANDYECVRMILDAKPDVSDPELFTETLGDYKIDDRIFEALLAAGVDPNYTEPDAKETYALYRWSSGDVHVKKLRALVNHPKFDTSKLPPFVVAVLKNDLEQIQAQVKAGADVNANFKGRTPIGMALGLGNLDAFKCMLHSPRGGEKKQVLLNMACEANQPEFVKLLLALPGIDVNGDVDGYCAIHRACDGNSVECLKLLLAMPGIDVNKRIGGNYFHKRTPLQCAESGAGGPHHECIRLLREAGATQ